MKSVMIVLVAGLFSLSGCAHVMSEESRNLTDQSITFPRLKENPDAYAGKFVMLGGIIAGVRNSKEGGELEVVQFNLDRSDVPEDTYNSGGRFLATSPTFLDAVVYKPGRVVTIVGEVKGKRTRALDYVDYTYPVISIRELHLVKGYRSDEEFPYPPPPPYYDPYYFGHWPDVYWFRPLGPPFRPDHR